MVEDDIFDDFELTDEEKKKILDARNNDEKLSDVSAKVISEEKKEGTTFADEEKHPKKEYKPKPTNRKVAGVIGLSLFVGVGVLLYLALTGAIDVVDDQPFDTSGCEFGVKSGFFEQRCMTEDEYTLANTFEQVDTSTGKPVIPSTPYKQVESITKKPDGYFSVTTTDSWYGDYIDGSEVPRKIDLNDRARVEFSCYVDDHLGTSVYFGTFRNNVDNDLTVEVYIGGLEADSKTTDSNKALILEGSCYGHES